MELNNHNNLMFFEVITLIYFGLFCSPILIVAVDCVILYYLPCKCYCILSFFKILEDFCFFH